MNKFKHKRDMKKIILKLKLKLDSSDESSLNDENSSKSKENGQAFKTMTLDT